MITVFSEFELLGIPGRGGWQARLPRGPCPVQGGPYPVPPDQPRQGGQGTPRPFCPGGWWSTSEGQGYRKGFRRGGPGNSPGRDKAGFQELHGNDGRGCANRVVQEFDGLQGGDGAEAVVVDDLDDLRFPDPVDGLRGLVVVEEDDGSPHIIEQGCPGQDAGKCPVRA